MNRVYVEGLVFPLLLSKDTESGKVVQDLFAAAKDGQLKIITSSWSTNQYTEELVFRYSDADAGPVILELVSRLITRWKKDLASAGNLVEIRLTDELLDSSLPYIINERLTAEQALHLYSAQVGRCDSLIIADKNFHLDKNAWKNEFEIYYLKNEEDRSRLGKELKSLSKS